MTNFGLIHLLLLYECNTCNEFIHTRKYIIRTRPYSVIAIFVYGHIAMSHPMKFEIKVD